MLYFIILIHYISIAIFIVDIFLGIDVEKHFFFLTNWSWYNMLIYFSILVYFTFQDDNSDFTPSWSLARKFCLVNFQVSFAMATTVTCAYWVLLYDGRAITIDNFALHILNFILICIELIVSNMPTFPVCTHFEVILHKIMHLKTILHIFVFFVYIL